MEEYNDNMEVGENPYEDYMVDIADSVDAAIPIMVGRIKTRLAFLEQFGASKEKLESSKTKWIGDILTFMVDKGVISNVAKASLLEIL